MRAERPGVLTPMKMPVIVTLLGILSGPIAWGSLAPQQGTVAAAPISRVDLETLSDNEIERILSPDKRVWDLAALYDFVFSEQEVYWPTLLRCPLWKRTVVLEYSGSEGSKFVALVYPDGSLALVPLFHHAVGLANYDAPLDPHNIAIFNRTLAEEPPDLTLDSIWLQEALCYFGIVDMGFDLVLPENIRESVRNPGSEALGRLLPPVVETSDEAVRVSLHDVLYYEVTADESRIVQWNLTFDRNGFLRRVERESGSGVLNPGGRN